MRVIAGTLKGRRLFAPSGDRTRPTSDRVKEAVFSMIGPYFEGGMCLDLFAGSGALAIEAISRGVDRGILVDNSSAETIRKNVESLGVAGRTSVWAMPYDSALKRANRESLRFTLVFLDPPYRLGVLANALDGLRNYRLLAPNAVVVAEMSRRTGPPVAESGYSLRRQAYYGDTGVCVYDWHGEDAEAKRDEDGDLSGKF